MKDKERLRKFQMEAKEWWLLNVMCQLGTGKGPECKSWGNRNKACGLVNRIVSVLIS